MNLLLTGETVATDAAAAGGFGGSIWVTVIYIAVFIGIFYFMLIKPQQKERRNSML